MAEADRTFCMAARKLIEEGLRTGEIRSYVDPPAYAALFAGTLRGLVMQHLMKPPAFYLDRVCRELILSIEPNLSPVYRTASEGGSRAHAR